MNIFEIMKTIKPGQVFYAEGYEGDKDYEFSVDNDGYFINGFLGTFILSKKDLELEWHEKIDYVDYLKALKHLDSGKTVTMFDTNGKYLDFIIEKDDIMKYTLLELHRKKFVLGQ
jgi:hypothetical protein